MFVPNEILLNVFHSLRKKDLKASRMVSTTWCGCASTFLLSEIYVSSAKEDLEAFEAVTRSPLLSSYVRSLKYDATEFLDKLTKSQYIAELWAQRPYGFPGDVAPHCVTENPETREWANDVIFARIPCQETIAKFRNSRLITKGHRKYKEHASYQQAALKSCKFLRRLVRGLRKLNSLNSVTLEGDWPPTREFDKRHTGSYLARHWDLFHCKPQCWRCGWESIARDRTFDSWNHNPDGSQSYRILVSALRQAQTHLVSFTVGFADGGMSLGLPPSLFDMSGYLTRQKASFSGPDMRIFSSVEKFLFRLASAYKEALEEETTPQPFANIDGLPLLLGSMENLKHLELSFSSDHFNSPAYYSNHKIFPEDTVLQNLESLKLVEFSITATDLLKFILHHISVLSHLEVGDMGLIKGTWEGLIEALTLSKRLTYFRFEDETYLFHRDDSDSDSWLEDNPPETYDDIGVFYKDLEAYVVRGGRHPCLRADQPDTKARDFLNEFEPELRAQLIDLGTSRPK